ncbi:MAG TPA: NAD-dependent epimerase/dehydratase family protein [Dehalococcoidia bacterium]|nr:NAD-dependent epimerase/dehydratase family protein [Dehalococcoidia bacterium]
MKVLITGANGFVGSHVAERLAARDGVALRLMLRSTSRLAFLEGVEYERVEGDLRDEASLAAAVQGAGTVIHVAGLVSALTEARYHEVNARGTEALVRAAKAGGVKRFVYVSSLAALGPSLDGVTPPATPRPVSGYGRSKLAGEYPVLAEKDAMSVAVVRPPAVYGERDRGLLPFYRIAKLGFVPVYGDGHRRLSFIHAHDAADAIIAAALAEGPSGAIYTINDGSIHTWRSLIAAFAKAAGRKVRSLPVPPLLFHLGAYGGGLVQTLIRRPLPLSPDEVQHMRARAWLADNEPILRDLGWQPRIDIEQGFAQAYRWYRECGWL